MKLTLQTNAIHLPVIKDGKNIGEIIINPDDTAFITKFYELIAKLSTAKDKVSDELGKAEGNAEMIIAAMNEMWETIMSEIDNVFGEKTSDLVFEGVRSISLCEQFFDEIAKNIEKVRVPKLEKYVKQPKTALK